MRHTLLFIIFFFGAFLCEAQTYNDSQKADTFMLKNIEIKKVIAYRINSVTILVDYNDFMKTFTPTWKRFKAGVKSLDKGKEKAIDENPTYLANFRFLDTTYKYIERQIHEHDTAYLDDLAFRLADMGHGFRFDNAIEAGNCIILDKDRQRQNIVLRQKYSYQRGFLDGWGGRLYFLQGDKKPFIRGTDRVS